MSKLEEATNVIISVLYGDENISEHDWNMCRLAAEGAIRIIEDE